MLFQFLNLFLQVYDVERKFLDFLEQFGVHLTEVYAIIKFVFKFIDTNVYFVFFFSRNPYGIFSVPRMPRMLGNYQKSPSNYQLFNIKQELPGIDRNYPELLLNSNGQQYASIYQKNISENSWQFLIIPVLKYNCC